MKAYTKYKDSGVPWLGEVPEHWGVKKLRVILRLRNEKNDPIKTEQILSLSIKKGVTLYSHKGRGGNKSKNDLTAYKIAHVGDIVLNSMNVIVGAVGLSKYTGAISPVYYAIYPISNNIDIRFYEKIFKNKSFQNFLLIYGKGILIKKSNTGKLNTIRMKISPDDIKSIILPIPPVFEQQQIARYLDWQTAKINRFIEARKKIIALLKEQKQNIVNEAVTKGINPDVEMKDSGVEWLGEIPVHWEVRRLKQIVRFNPSKNENIKIASPEEKVVFLPMEKISVDGNIDCSLKSELTQVSDGFTYFAKNDVLIAKITPCFENGKGAFLSELDTAFGFGTTELFVLRPSPKIHGMFLRYLSSSRRFLEIGAQYMSGAAGQQRVQSSFLKNYELGLPPKEEQLMIVDFLKKETSLINKTISRTEREIELIEEYRTRLVSDVVTGKADIRSVEIPDFEPAESNPEVQEDEEYFEDKLIMEGS